MQHGLLATYTKAERTSVPFSDSLLFFKKQRPLIVWTIFILLVIFLITLLFFSLFTRYIEMNFHFIITEPGSDASVFWNILFWLMNGLFSLFLKVFAFYFSFLIAYTATAPLYQFLSVMTEDLFRGKKVKEDSVHEFEEIMGDYISIFPLSFMLFAVLVVALIANFIPFFGPILCFIVLCFSSALLLIAFPATRLGWEMQQKIEWLIKHPVDTFRLGLFPLLISFIPVISPFIMGIASPFLVVHATLNFILKEESQKILAATVQTKNIS